MRGQVRPLHLRVRSRVLIPGHGHRLSFGPCYGFTGRRVESPAQARRTDQFGAVAVSQPPGHERPGPVAAGDPPSHLEGCSAGPASDREDPDIE